MQDFGRLEDKLDKVFDALSEQGRKLERHSVLHEKNTEDLADHIKRTNLLEQKMDETTKAHDAKLDLALLPIRVLKVIVAAAAGMTTIYALIKLLIP